MDVVYIPHIILFCVAFFLVVTNFVICYAFIYVVIFYTGLFLCNIHLIFAVAFAITIVCIDENYFVQLAEKITSKKCTVDLSIRVFIYCSIAFCIGMQCGPE